jgi:hypothetical protein
MARKTPLLCRGGKSNVTHAIRVLTDFRFVAAFAVECVDMALRDTDGLSAARQCKSVAGPLNAIAGCAVLEQDE